MTSRDHRPCHWRNALKRGPAIAIAVKRKNGSTRKRRPKDGFRFFAIFADALAARQYTDEQGCEAASNVPRSVGYLIDTDWLFPSIDGDGLFLGRVALLA